MTYLELLAPAKNADQGIAAINHGADAVYIGAPLFGARSAAGNSLEDIERLVKYAHIFGSKVFATVNTLLFDHELESANKLIHQLYNIGTDALIIQDLGLLETDLPPIALHASTQTHNFSIERVKFLEQVGFKRIILARETSLEQMKQIRNCTSIELESFVQGALCVCFSGQCYMSQYLNGRSGNRGCCGQPCRSTYDLYAPASLNASDISESKGINVPSHSSKLTSFAPDIPLTLMQREQHLLSLKDFNASRHLSDMVAAGITSFKIEGRLKDLSYVKNVTAFYRQLLDSMMENKHSVAPASHGKTTFYFTPDLERTFNRGFTDYCLPLTSNRSNGHQDGRQKMASFDTQKSLGKIVGTVTAVTNGTLTLRTTETFASGDGLCLFVTDKETNTKKVLSGFTVNKVEILSNTQQRITPNNIPDNITLGSTLWRNNDFAFEKLLQGKTADRKIAIRFILSTISTGLSLEALDFEGHSAFASVSCETSPSRDPQKAAIQIEKQLAKLGDTTFTMVSALLFPLAADLQNNTPGQGSPFFIPASVVNELRRNAVAELTNRLIESHRPHDASLETNNTPNPESHLDYRANILNKNATQFYQRHGVTDWEYGLEKTQNYMGKALMTTKYCLRYELGICLMARQNSDQPANCKTKSLQPQASTTEEILPKSKNTDLYLRNNKNLFRIHFDCAHCQMEIFPTTPQPVQ